MALVMMQCVHRTKKRFSGEVRDGVIFLTVVC